MRSSRGFDDSTADHTGSAASAASVLEASLPGRLHAELPSFDYQPRTRVVFGPGTVERLGELARELGGTRALLVTDAGLRAAGHAERGAELLRSAGIECVIFDDVQPNPTTDDVDRALQVARAAEINLLVGLGGGSAMDCAKGVNFLFTNGGRMEDYWGVGKATRPMLPMIAVPTTAGTGSEAQSFALIAQASSHMKMACGDPKAACRVAILDPLLTLSMPVSVTAATGIDAISHAVESFVTSRRNPVSQLFSRKAWQLMAQGFPAVLRRPDHAAARAGMLLGAHLAGAAIENSMLGATHSLANPVSAHFGVVHGVAIGVLLPHVIRFNAANVGPLYALLERDLAGAADGVSVDGAMNAKTAGGGPSADGVPTTGGERLAAAIAGWVEQAGLPVRLRECGVERGLLDEMSQEAARQWTASFNPRPVDAAALRELYECAF